MKTSVLVTGGEGFVGYHLCKKLVELNYEVVSLDLNLANRNDRRVLGVEYINNSTTQINEIFSDKIFDLIFHLGEYSRIENSFDNVDLVVDSNIIGTAKVLEYWKKTGSKLIYAGSSTKFSVGMSAYKMSPYSFTKSTNTELVKSYGEWFNLKYAITYFYNVYGDKENFDGKLGSVVGIFLNLKKNNLPIRVVLPGTQKRNFTHVDDIVEGLILVAMKGNGDEYGIGSEDSYSINELADMVGGDIEYVPERRGNRLASELVTVKTKELGWEPKRFLKDYIIKNI